MLESVVSSVLNRVLDDFVENLNTEQLRISLWNGDVKLEHLVLKRQLLDKLSLPMTVKQGFLGKLVLQIPWKNLKTEPVHIVIDEILLVTCPKKGNAYNAAQEEEDEWQRKRSALGRYEEMRTKKAEPPNASSSPKGPSFVTRLVTKIIDNLQISIGRIHIRYEDNVCDPSNPFAVGATLNFAGAVSTNEKWEEGFFERRLNLIYKLVHLDSLSLYWLTDAELYGDLPASEFRQRCEQTIARKDTFSFEGSQYVLMPVSGRLKLRINTDAVPDMAEPRLMLDVEFDQISAVLDDRQYYELFLFLDSFGYYMRGERYRRFRPDRSVSVKKNPRMFWQFACNSVLSDVHEKLSQFSWARMANRRDQRKKYIDVYIRRQLKKDPVVDKELESLERVLSVADITFYRSLAELEIRKNRLVAPKPPKSGWLGGWFGSSSSSSSGAESQEWTDQDTANLFRTIDYNPAEGGLATMPENYIDTVASARLKSLEIILRRKSGSVLKPFVHVRLMDILFEFQKRSGSFVADAKITDFEVFQISPSTGATSKLIRRHAPRNELPLFQLFLEHSPLDRHADEVVKVNLQPLCITVDQNSFAEIARFFLPPSFQQQLSLDQIKKSASSSLNRLTQQTRIGLQYALEQRRTVDVDVSLDAPIIFVPFKDMTGNVLVVDLGRFELKSELAANRKETQDEFRRRQAALTEAEMDELRSLTYDTFNIRFSLLQIFMMPSLENSVERSDIQPIHRILEQVALNVTLRRCIVESVDLPNLKLDIEVPPIYVNFSDRKFQTIMRMINEFVDTFAFLSKKGSPPSSTPRELESASQTGLATDRSSQPLMLLLPHEEEESNTDAVATAAAASRSRSESGSSSSDDSQDVFYDAQETLDRSSMEQLPSLAHKAVKASIRVEIQNVSLRLGVEDDNSFTPLLLLSLLNAKISVTQRPYDLSVNALLDHALVKDFALSGSDGTPIVQVRPDKSHSALVDAALNVQLVIVDKESPEYALVYRKKDLNIKVAMAALELTLDPRTTMTYVDFFSTGFQMPTEPEKAKSDESASQLAGDRKKIGGQSSSSSSTQLLPASAPTSDAQANTPETRKQPSTNVSVEVIFGGAVVHFDDEEGCFLCGITEACHVAVTMESDSLTVEGKLGHITLDAKTPKLQFEHFPHLATTKNPESDSAISFVFRKFDPSQSVSVGHDMSVSTDISPLQLFLQYPQVMTLVEYFLRFRTLEPALKTSAEAATATINSVREELVQRAPRVLIRAEMQPVQISMIQSSHSEERIVFYLGHVSVSNKFADRPEGSFDDMSVCVTGLTCRAHSQSSYGGELIEQDLLPSMVLQLDLLRYLSPPTLEIPSMEMNVSVSMARFTLSDTVLNTVLRMLVEFTKTPRTSAAASSTSEDPSSSDMPSPTSSSSSSSNFEEEKTKMDSSTTAESSAVTTVVAGEASSVVQSQDVDNRRNIEIAVKLEGIQFVLLTESSPKTGPTDRWNPLALFKLEESDVHFAMDNAGQMKLECVLAGVHFIDSRPSASGMVVDMLSCQPISVTYTNCRQYVSVTVDTPRIVAVFGFWLPLADFFVSPYQSVFGSGVESSSRDVSKETKRTVEHSTEERNRRSRRDGANFTLKANVLNASLTIASDGNWKNGSDGLGCEFPQISFFMEDDKMTLNMTKISAGSAQDGKLHESGIVRPFSINVSADTTDETTVVGVDSMLVDVYLSYQNIRTLMAIADSYSKAAQNTRFLQPKIAEKPSEGQPDLLQEISLANVQVSLSDSLDTLPRPRRHHVALPTKPQSTEKLTVSVKGISIFIINDCNNAYSPLFHAQMTSLATEVRDWSSNLQVKCDMEAKASLFNSMLVHWEPVLEAWTVSLRVEKLENQAMSLRLQSGERMEVSLTVATLNVIMGVLNSWSEDMKKKDSAITSEGASTKPFRYPYQIRNETGEELSVWDCTTDHADVHALKAGDECGITFRNWSDFQHASDANEISVQIKDRNNFQVLPNISISTIGKQFFALQPSPKEFLYRLVCDVRFSGGTRYVTFRSPISFENNTGDELDLEIQPRTTTTTTATTATSSALTKRIDKGASFAVPLSLTDFSFVLKPVNATGQYSWSNPFEIRSIFTSSKILLSCQSKTLANLQHSFSVQRNIEETLTTSLKTTTHPSVRLSVCPPIILENLLPLLAEFVVLYGKGSTSVSVGSGESKPFFAVSSFDTISLQLRIPSLKFVSLSSHSLAKAKDKDVVHVVAYEQDTKHSLSLHIGRQEEPNGSLRIVVYCSHIIVNQTGLDIKYQKKQAFAEKLLSDEERTMRTNELTSFKKESQIITLLSFTKWEARHNSIMIRTGAADWSQPFNIDATGTEFEVFMTQSDSGTNVSLGVSVSIGEGIFHRSKVIYLVPRVFLINQSGLPAMEVRSSESAHGPRAFGSNEDEDAFLFRDPFRVTVKKDEASSLCYFTERTIAFRPSDDWPWSRKIPVDAAGDFSLALEKPDASDKSASGPSSVTYGSKKSAKTERLFLRVVVSVEKSSFIVTFLPSPGAAPFRVDNFSEETLAFYQSGDNDRIKKVPPKTGVPFFWWNPSMVEKMLYFVADNGKTFNVDISFVGDHPHSLTIKEGKRKLKLRGIAEEETLVLQIFPHDGVESRLKSASSADLMRDRSLQLTMMQINFEVKLQLAGLGLSLVDATSELLYLTLQNAHVEYVDTVADSQFTFKIEKAQIDNQTERALFPTLLRMTPLEKEYAEEQQAKQLDFLYLSTVFLKRRSKTGVQVFQYFSFLMQSVDIQVSERYVYQLARFGQNVMASSASAESAVPGQLITPLDMNEYRKTHEESVHSTTVYFELFELQPMQFNVAFYRTLQDEASQPSVEVRSRFNVFRYVTDILSMAAGNIDAPVKLNALEIHHILASQDTFVRLISKHYLRQLIGQVYMLIGSVDILGNPVGLFQNVATGLQDFFYAPWHGLQRGPQDFAKGLGIGTSSLVKKSVVGILDSATKVTSSLSKGIAEMTMDDQFKAQREAAALENRNASTLQGFQAGASSIYKGFSQGLTGLFQKPIEGAKKEGAAGFLSGVGVGVVGVVAKPVVGILEGASHAVTGIKNVSGGEESTKVRLPRFVSLDQRIYPYSIQQAFGVDICSTLRKKMDPSNPLTKAHYLAHRELISDNSILVVTDLALILCKAQKKSIERVFLLPDLADPPTACEEQFLALRLKPGSDSANSLPDKGTTMYKIYLPDPSQQSVTEKDIQRAIVEWRNSHDPLRFIVRSSSTGTGTVTD